MSNIDTYLNIHQFLTTEEIRSQNETILKATLENNAEIKKLQQQLKQATALNNQILENQLRDARHKEEQIFYKAYVFKVSEIVDTISEIGLPILKYHFNKTFLNGTIDEVEAVIEKLDEITDKQITKEILKKAQTISKETLPISNNYDSSNFPKLITLIQNYKTLEKTIPNKPAFKTKAKEFSKNKITFWSIFHSTGALVSLYFAFNNYPIIGGFFTFIFLLSLKTDFQRYKSTSTFKIHKDEYDKLIIPNYEKEKTEVQNRLKSHELHSYIEQIDNEYKDYSYYSKELEKIEVRFYTKWGLKK